MPQPAIALIEFTSIAVGTTAGDAMIKRAPIAAYRAGTIQPGRFLVLITGSVADVDESYHEGLRIGGETVIDSVFLPDAHESVHAAVLGRRSPPDGESLGIIETATVAAVVHAADAAVKGAAVTIREIRLGDGLDGKGIVHFDGELPDVQAGVEIGVGVAVPRGIEVRRTVIPAVHALVTGEIGRTTRFNR
jgi:microcompartment protein CcmL/EutN